MKVLLNVNFTAWKWGITATFGMLPLLACILYFLTRYIFIPLWRIIKSGWTEIRAEGIPPAWRAVRERRRAPVDETKTVDPGNQGEAEGKSIKPDPPPTYAEAAPSGG